ncbi:MAG: GH92 family glycosyl hydrolase [Paraglaciecola polaris]|uniref:GH92 family glycosyl hydrolase n=1 Tax=Paraglaciecola polaris TaxID=222814 RepID=UPI0030032667|tara:strand:- start:63524 stop:65788 length:2265 start_codon:yes stop_codon:yes gene_type:complete
MKALLTITLSLFALSSSTLSLAQEQQQSPADFVNPFVGTSNFGATHPGAQYPHALTSVAPFNVAFEHEKLNKFEKDAAWNSRVYIHENKFLTGFTHVNLSGVGCPELGVINIMPTAGDLELDAQKYGSTYSDEHAKPGYYQTTLDKYDIKAEATSTLRTGLSRYTFNAGQGNIILNLGLGLTNETGGSLKIVSDHEIEGSRTVGTFCYNPQDVRPVYFVARFSKPAKSLGTFKKMPKFTGVEGEWMQNNDSIKSYPNYRHVMSGDNIGAYMRFDTEAKQQIEVKVGISYVSIENARQNLATEQPTFAFDETRSKAKKAWNALLSRIEVQGSDNNKTLLYTGLYHSLIHPSIIQDVNGEYPIMSQQHTAQVGNTQGKNRYSVYSLWDTSRNLHPLLSLLYPEIQSQMVDSALAMYQESGWLPKWELLSMETQTMVGDPATAMIADTYLRGVDTFDIEQAYRAMQKSADTLNNNPIRPENQDYLTLGYVPVDDEEPYDGSVSTSLEYYVADFALGSLANALGHEQDALKYLTRAQGYRHLFDNDTGMLRPKKRSGEWLTPYDPELGRNFEPAPGYIEGNAWNYRFYVPFDIPGMIDLLGGDSRFIDALNATFATNNFDMGNEPDITYPYLFNYVSGQEHQTALNVQKLMAQHFTDQPAGLPGNDDAGTMSAWLVFSMLGIYPVSPGDMDYATSSTAFDKVTVHLDQAYYPGKTLLITPLAKDQKQPMLNNKTLTNGFVTHQQLTQGGSLKLLAPVE